MMIEHIIKNVKLFCIFFDFLHTFLIYLQQTIQDRKA
jgi:hypothetical protein